MSIAHMGGDKALLLCQHGGQGTPLSGSSRRRRGSPLYLGRAVTPGPQTRGEVAGRGRLDMFHTTKEHQSCWAGAPTAMWHCVSRALHARLPVTPCASPWRSLPTTIARRMAVGGPSVARTPHDSTPSSSHKRGTAGLEKGAMAFLDDAE